MLLSFFAAMVIVAKYFDEKRSFAVGIACCGSGIGTLVFAEFIEFLLKDAQLSWRTTFQVLHWHYQQIVLVFSISSFSWHIEVLRSYSKSSQYALLIL